MKLDTCARYFFDQFEMALAEAAGSKSALATVKNAIDYSFLVHPTNRSAVITLQKESFFPEETTSEQRANIVNAFNRVLYRSGYQVRDTPDSVGSSKKARFEWVKEGNIRFRCSDIEEFTAHDNVQQIITSTLKEIWTPGTSRIQAHL